MPVIRNPKMAGYLHTCVILSFILCTPLNIQAEKYHNPLPSDAKERLWSILNALHPTEANLREMYALAPNHIPVLLRILNDPDARWLPIARVMMVIPTLGDQRVQFIPLVKARLLDKNSTIRRSAIGCLQEFPGVETRIALISLIGDPDWTTACAAGRAMVKIGTTIELKAMRDWLEQQKKFMIRHDAFEEIQQYASELELRLRGEEKLPKK